VTHSFSIVVVSQRSEIERVADLVDRFGAAHHLPDDVVVAIHLVLDEVVVNIIEHGYDDDLDHHIHVSLALDGDLLTIRVEDDGKAFNPLEAPPPDLDLPIEDRPIGGLGIYIVRSNVDAIEYRREAGRNILTMKKHL
jgi:anti-sigma regulatory factor (Ser/Thr protein kinase)